MSALPLGSLCEGNKIQFSEAKEKPKTASVYSEMFMTYENLRRSVPEIEKILGYTFRDKSLLMQAFTRSSWCNENGKDYQSNEVLEFFGDSVLSAVIISFLLSQRTERYRFGIKTELCEGDFSNIKSKLSDKTNLSKSTKRLGLEKYLLMGEGDVKLGIMDEPSVMEDLFESIVGAVYIDTGKDIGAVTAVVSRILDMSVYQNSTVSEVSPKNALQEWLADKRRRLPAPIYRTVEERGPDHKKVYIRGAYVGERLVATGEGKNQKTADSKAAEEALRILKAEEAERYTAIPDPNAGKESPAPKVKKELPEPKAKKNSPEPVAKAEAAASRTVKKSSAPAPKSESSKKSKGESSSPVPTQSALLLLKKHAQSASVATPAFRDLGTFGSGDDLEYHIECSYMERRVIAAGVSRIDARERAALLIAKELKIV